MGLGEEREGGVRGWRKGGDKENYQRRAEKIGKGDYGRGGDIMGKGGLHTKSEGLYCTAILKYYNNVYILVWKPKMCKAKMEVMITEERTGMMLM
jgi:hypothetical protein